MTRHRVFQLFLTLSCIAVLLWIFSNSLQSGPASAVRSGAATAQINQLPFLHSTGLALSEHLIRKLGHLAEYTLYGLLLGITTRTYTCRLRRGLPLALLIGTISAACDELLQRLSPGRSCQFGDVLLDTGGVALGLFIALLLICAQKIYRQWRSGTSRDLV